LVTVRASNSSYLTTGGAAQVVAFPGTPQVGDPVGIWLTTNDTTITIPSTPTGWTLEYATAVGSGWRAFLHKVYASGDGSSVTVTFSKQPNMAIATVVFDGSVHSGFGAIGTVTTRSGSSTSSTAVATGSISVPNLVVFHEKTTSQTSCTVTGCTAIENRLPTTGFAGSVYVGWYDDTAATADQTASYGLTANANGAGYQIPIGLAGNTPAVGSAALALAGSATISPPGGSASLDLQATGTAFPRASSNANLSLVAAGASPAGALVNVRASTSGYTTTGGAAQTIAFPGAPQYGDPVGIWITCNDSTITVPSAPANWTMEYDTTVGSGFRVFLHKIYDDGVTAGTSGIPDGSSVVVTFSKQPNMAVAVVVFNGSVHASFGTPGTITSRPSASTVSTAVAAGSAAAPNLLVFHEKTTSQTSCVVSAGSAIQNVLPPNGSAGSVYVGFYDDTTGPTDQTATYGLTGNVNGAGYQLPLLPPVDPGAITAAATIALAATGTVQIPTVGTATLTLTGGTTTPVQQWMARTRWYAAHRGGSADWPEETLFAYDQAAAWNSELALEISVWQSSDGVYVCSHDQTTGRVFGTNLDIPTSTWAELSGLTAGGKPIAKLTDVLNAHANGSRVIFADNKGGQNNSSFLDLLASYGGPARFIIKSFCTGTQFADAGAARGYQGWGYYFDPDVAVNLPNTQSHWSILGMDYTATSADWTAVMSYGKPVIGHIVPTLSGANTALAFGARGIMASGVMEVVSNDTPTSTASLTLAASGTVKAGAAGTAGLTLGAAGTVSLPAVPGAALTLTGSGTAHVAATAGGALTLTASATAGSHAAGSGSIILAATGGPQAAGTATASLELQATGDAEPPGGASMHISLVAAGTVGAHPAAAATLSLVGSAAAVAAAGASAALSLLGTGTFLPQHASGAASLVLTASGTLRVGVAGAAGMVLLSGAALGSRAAGAGHLNLAAAGSMSAGRSGTAALSLLASGMGRASLAGTATLLLSAFGRPAADGPSVIGVWDGTRLLPAILLGVWDGTTVQPATVLEITS
jgi:hypothetical protein